MTDLTRLPLERVCIVMMSAVGDAVHVLPVINALKRRAPAVHITWVLQPGPATLVRGHRSVDEIIDIRPRTRLARVHRHSARARAALIRPRHQSAGVLQGGNRHHVHACPGQARVRSRACARLQLAVHHGSHSAACACSTCRISTSSFSRRSVSRTSRSSGTSVRGRPSATRSASSSRRSSVRLRRSSSRRARRKKTGFPSDGPTSPTRCGTTSDSAGARRRTLAARAACRASHSRSARDVGRARASAAACEISWRFSTRRRSCSRRTPARCTWPLRSIGR